MSAEQPTQQESKQSSGIEVESWAIGIVALLIIGYTAIYLPNKAYIDSGKMWRDLGKIVGGLIIVGGVVFVTGRRLWTRYKQRKQARTQLGSLMSQVKDALHDARTWPEHFEEGAPKLQAFAEELRSWPKGFLHKEAQHLLTRLESEQNKLRQRFERDKNKEENKRRKELEEKRQRISIVYQAFLKQGHAKTIPETCKYFSKEIIENAKRWYNQHVNQESEKKMELQKQEKNRKRACLFVWKYRALPAHFAQLPNDEKEHYEEALGLLKSGKLKTVIQAYREQEHVQTRKDYLTDEEYTHLAGSVAAGKAREKELVQQDFYFESELNNAEQNFLLTFHGFKRFNVSNYGDGFLPALYLCSSSQNESPQHFCTKHLFARLHPSARVEYVDGSRNEIDVLFTKGKQKIAVEIERGTNKPDYVRQKVADLRRTYAKVVLQVPRKALPKYRVYHDGKKVFVFTAKKAKEALLQWLK